MLDHALTGPEGADNCNKFVEILGLRTIFPLFMKTPGKHGNKGLTKDQVCIIIIIIIYGFIIFYFRIYVLYVVGRTISLTFFLTHL